MNLILSPYQSFLAERDEILRHKWIESEKAGHDIGFEAALFDWVTNCRALWKKEENGHKEPKEIKDVF